MIHAKTFAPGTEPAYLQEGNLLMMLGQFQSAESHFRKAIEMDPENENLYQSQVALSLMEQQKYDQAETELAQILERNPNEVGALWYRSLNYFHAKQYVDAINSFYYVLPKFSAEEPQIFAAHWFIGTSFKSLLQSSGLNYLNVDKMLDAFDQYLNLQPNAPDKESVEKFIAWVKENRPPGNVKLWVVPAL